MLFNLQNGIVGIYYLRNNSDTDVGIHAAEFLDRDELQYYHRCSSIGRKNHFLLGRALAKSVLSGITGLPVKNISMERDHYSRLRLKNFCDKSSGNPAGRIDFNLSHSGEVTAFAAILDGKVGIDVELMEREVHSAALAFFHEREIGYLMSCGNGGNKNACRLWTMKESYVKCKGRGLAIPFDSFNVLENHEVIYKSFYISGYCISVAVESQHKNINVGIREMDIGDLHTYVGNQEDICRIWQNPVKKLKSREEG